MDFCFRETDEKGRVIVENIYDNEVFKHWLNCEIDSDLLCLITWIDELKRLDGDGVIEHTWVGKEYSVVYEDQMISIFANHLFNESDPEEMNRLKEENLSIMTDECYGCCHIESFIKLLEDYRDFIEMSKN